MNLWNIREWVPFVAGGLLVLVFAVIPLVVCGQSVQIWSADGKYLGNLNSNRFDPNSVSNPFGRYGSQFSPDSINNQFGKYGNPFSPYSVQNPYSTGGFPVVQPWKP